MNTSTPKPSEAHKLGLIAVRTGEKAVRTFQDILFILIMLIGLWYLADTIYVFYHSRTEAMLPHKPESIEELKKTLSKDAVGWITLDDTSIDYPVMQGVDNYEYLNKDPYGEYSLSGSVFLDSRNASDFSDAYCLLYAHHMSGGFMFGALDFFEDPAYFESHQTGTIFTERGTFPVKVLAFTYTDASEEMVFDPGYEKNQDLSVWIKEHAVNYDPAAEGGIIVALSTCKSPTSTRRMIVFVTIQE